MSQSLHHRILSHLEEVATQKQEQLLDGEILPALAQALEPVIAQYISKKGTFPDPNTLHAIALNLNQDAPRVFALLETRHADESHLWARLRNSLEQQARRRWPSVGATAQKEIANRAWLRIHRHLPSFLFMARFSTWATRILLNEYLRLKPKLDRDRQAVSLDQADHKGRTLADILPEKRQGLPEKVAHSQAIEHFWRRMEQLEQSLNLKILRLHLAGYKLEEIKQQLGGKPSASTICKRRQQIIARIEQDSIMQEIAQQLGILPLKEEKRGEL